MCRGAVVTVLPRRSARGIQRGPISTQVLVALGGRSLQASLKGSHSLLAPPFGLIQQLRKTMNILLRKSVGGCSKWTLGTTVMPVRSDPIAAAYVGGKYLLAPLQLLRDFL